MKKWFILLAFSFVAFQAGQALACTSAGIDDKTVAKTNSASGSSTILGTKTK